MTMWRMVLATMALALPAVAHASERLTVMTFNVRLLTPADGANDWDHRRRIFTDTVARADPDVIGTQELFKKQGDDVVAALPRYTWFGRDRKGGSADEHMGIFYRRDRMTLVGSGDFWLSDTPSIPGRITWGHPNPRMVTWGKFRTSEGRIFYLFNTHLPYRAEDDAAREKGAALIDARIAAIAGDAPVVLTGDFNAVPESRTHAILSEKLTDAWVSSTKRSGPAATFHNFTGKPDRRIDWIMVRGLTTDRIETVTTNRDGRYPSDHFPVQARLRFAPAKR